MPMPLPRRLALLTALALPALAPAQKLTTPVDVMVVNKLTQPVPVIDRSAAQPVSGYCAGPLSAIGCTLYVVPTGKRLVVETVSYLMTVGLANQANRLAFGKLYDSPLIVAPGLYAVAPVPLSTSTTLDTRRYAGSQPLRIYLDQGETLAVQFGSDGGPNYEQNAAFSGYLVDR